MMRGFTPSYTSINNCYTDKRYCRTAGCWLMLDGTYNISITNRYLLFPDHGAAATAFLPPNNMHVISNLHLQSGRLAEAVKP